MALEERLELDAADALRAIDSIEAALERAAQSFKVALADALDVLGQVSVGSVDASSVTAGINAAVDAADLSATVTADTAGVTSEVTAAVDAADTTATVSADTSDVTGEITGAVDAADTTVDITAITDRVTAAISGAVDAADTTVTITADTTEAQQEVSELGGAAGSAAAGVNVLGGSLRTAATAAVGLIGGRELIQFFNDAVTASSDLAESTSKATVVFGEAVDGVEEFAETSATSVGLAKQEALEFAGTFGNLLTALGLTKDAAAELSPEIIGLGADLASFNNLGVSETLERIRSGLVGEIEPLRSLGISFNEATVAAKAQELGLGAVNEELTEGEKVQARWALIVEQSTAAAGDFARTSEGLANQQRIARAEFRNLLSDIGDDLIPVILDLTGAARDDLIPAVGELAKAAIPLLSAALQIVGPLLGVVADVASAAAPALEGVGTAAGVLAPIFQAIAFVIDSIPDPLLRAVSSFVAMRIALIGLQTVLVGLGVSFTTALGPIGLVATGVSAVVGILAALRQNNTQTKASVDDLTQSFADQAKSIEQDTEALANKLVVDKEAQEALRLSGLSLQEFTDLAGQGEDGFDAFLDSLVRSGLVLPEVARQVKEAGGASDLLSDANEAATGTNLDLVESFVELANSSQQAANAQLTQLVNTRAITEEQRKAALESTRNSDGTLNYVAALESLEGTADDTAGALDAVTASNIDLRDSFDATVQRVEDTRQALEDYTDTVFDVIRLQDSAEDAERSYADALRNVADKEADLADARRDRNDATRDAISQERALNSLEDATAGVTEAERALARAREGRGERAKQLSEAEKGLAEAQQRVSEAAGEVTTAADPDDRARATKRLADAQEQLADATERLDDARAEGGQEQDITDATEKLERAQLDAREAALRLAEAREQAADREKAALADVRQAERDLIDARNDATDAAVAAASAQVELATRLAELTGTPLLPEDRVRLFREALVEVADQATGPTKAAILGVIDDLDTLTSTPHAIELEVDAEQAQKQLDDFLKKFDEQLKTLTFDVAFNRSAIPFGGGRRPGAMAGGTFLGPGSFVLGEGGREVVSLAPAVSATVLPNRQTEALLAGRGAIDPALIDALKAVAARPTLSAQIVAPPGAESDPYSGAVETARQLQSLAVRLLAAGGG